MNDETWMRRALHLAEKGRGRTSPNPMVGAVLVKDGQIVGEGYHDQAGGDHAEVIALRKAEINARGATLYLNLEPCTHFGRTPPCVPQIIEAGVRRVVIGMMDPNPLVNGKGSESLVQAGLNMTMGILEKECQKLNEAFSKYILKKEPFVILKVAATLDGKIATRDGNSKWISGEASRRYVHRLRDQVDGIIVGIGTILRDDPLLTARIKKGRNPYRIVLDSRLRIPERSKVVERSPLKTIIITTERAPKERVKRLEERGIKIFVVDSKAERVNLKSCLSVLGDMEMVSLMVEGGSQVNGSFLDEKRIDKLILFISPKLIGDSQAPGIFGGKGAIDLTEAFSLRKINVRRIGGDILIIGY